MKNKVLLKKLKILNVISESFEDGSDQNKSELPGNLESMLSPHNLDVEKMLSEGLAHIDGQTVEDIFKGVLQDGQEGHAKQPAGEGGIEIDNCNHSPLLVHLTQSIRELPETNFQTYRNYKKKSVQILNSIFASQDGKVKILLKTGVTNGYV